MSPIHNTPALIDLLDRLAEAIGNDKLPTARQDLINLGTILSNFCTAHKHLPAASIESMFVGELVNVHKIRLASNAKTVINGYYVGVKAAADPLGNLILRPLRLYYRAYGSEVVANVSQDVLKIRA